MYAADMGTLPASFDDLAKPAVNRDGVKVQFMGAVPAPPAGGTEYRYERFPDGTFTITTSVHGQEYRVP